MKKIDVEWFKCSEKLPPDKTQCLVFDGDSFAVGQFGCKEKWGEYYFHGEQGPLWGVTHWAYLPNPPKE